MKRLAPLFALATFTLGVHACKRTPAPPPPGPGASTSDGSTDTARTPDTEPVVSSIDAPLPDASLPAEVIDDAELIRANNHAVGLMGMFRYQDAIDTWAPLIREHPNWLDAQTNVAIAVINRQLEGDEALGLRILEAVLAIDPAHPRAQFTSGILLKRGGGEEEATQRFRAVVEADSADAYAAYYLAQSVARTSVEEAITWMERSIEIDPYLRSGYYGLFQLLQRSGRSAEAQPHLEMFNRLENNPRARLVKEVYTRMGPKAEAVAVNLESSQRFSRPAGPLIAAPAPLLDDGDAYTWNTEAASRSLSITVADINSDGRLDFFLADALRDSGVATNAVILAGENGYAMQLDHPFCTLSDIRAALWGDYDNDGLTDVYFCRRGPNQLWRQVAAGHWENVTASTLTAGGDRDTVDGAMVDADHDGDLDLFCVNADGPNELLNNNRDGTFRPIAVEHGIAGEGRSSRQVLFADLDLDRDADIIVINDEPPHEVYINDRLWAYHAASGVGLDAFRNWEIRRAAVADTDGNGEFEVLALLVDGSIARLARGDGGGAWTFTAVTVAMSDAGRLLAVEDMDGDGRGNLLGRTPGSWFVLSDGAPIMTIDEAGALRGWALAALDPARGPSIVGLPEAGPPLLWQAGSGRFGFMSIELTGRTEEAKDMRSNASGIGAVVAARRDSRWTIVHSFPRDPGPGQSDQPLPIGLGGEGRLDYLNIDWSDGLFQSEVMGVPPLQSAAPRSLIAGSLERIEETQRQASSCPVLFAWNGERFEFVSDVLGVGGMGYLLEPGVYAEPRPNERFLFPEGSIEPKDGRYIIKLAEPMEEACYLDAVSLTVYDLPPDWHVTLDERMATGDPPPTGEAVFYGGWQAAKEAINDRGRDMADALRHVDGLAADVGELDPRFIGRLKSDHVLTLTFASPIDLGRDMRLMIDGWIEYPYSQTMFAAWQAGASFRPPTVEARAMNGEWKTVLSEFGYPAGMPRQMSVPLRGLPVATTELRITTNQEVYFDRIAVIGAVACEECRQTTITPSIASLAETGFATRTTGPQRRPHYDYSHRPATWPARWLRGMYTRHGDVMPLIKEADGGVVVFGPGEEVHLEFEAPPDPVLDDWTRVVILDLRGWCKDADLMTGAGETVEPMPEATEAARRIIADFNTRHGSGR